MTLRIVIPVRPPEEGKTRLAGVLSDTERFAFNWRFFEHVPGVASEVIGARHCLVGNRIGAAFRTVDRPGLARDTPAYLAELVPGLMSARR